MVVFATSSDVVVSVAAMSLYTDHAPTPLILAVAVLLLASCGDADLNVTFDQDPAVSTIAPLSSPVLAAEIDSLVVDPAVPSLAWATVDDGVITSGASGDADLEAHREATTETAYAVGSVSKSVLSAVVMSLVEDGDLDLDTDVNTYLALTIDNPLVDDEVITLRSLMTHTSGIIDNDEVYQSQYRYDGDAHMALDDFLTAYLVPEGDFYDPIQNFSATSTFSYSNIGAGLVGHIVEERTGDSLDAVAAERIFAPLGMTNTGWRLGSFDHVEHVATPYSSRASGLQPIGHVGFPTYPDGGLRSSAVDLARFVGMIAGRGTFDGTTVLDPDTVAEMIDGRLFWGDIGEFIGHGGFDPGAQAEILFHPTDGFGAVVLTNSDGRAAGQAIGAARTALITDHGYAIAQAQDDEDNPLVEELERATLGVPGDLAVGLDSGSEVMLVTTGELASDATVPSPALTSTILSVIVHQLIDAGTVTLDRPVKPLLDDDLASAIGLDITISDLLDHSAGLPSPIQNLGPDATIDDLIASVDFNAVREPGAFSLTHNLVAIKVLESITGQPIATLIQDKVLEPAGVGETRMVTSASDAVHVSLGSLPGPAGTAVSTGEFGDGISLAGTIITTTGDAVALIRALLDGRLFADNSDALERMTPATGSATWGAGILDRTDLAGIPAAGTAGDIPGYQSFIAWTADGGVIVTVTATSEFIDIEQVTDALIS